MNLSTLRDDLQAVRLARKPLSVICLSVFLLATGTRLLHWQNNWLTVDKTMTGLVARYKEEAQYLLNGDIASFIRGSSIDPDPAVLNHPPGYPILIAFIYKLTGRSVTALRLFQALCGAAAAVLVFLIAAQMLPKGAAIIAGLLVALSPQLAYYSLPLLPDSISGIPILLAIYLIVRTRGRPRIMIIIAAGGLIGISCWLRANALLLAPFLCLLIIVLFERGKRLRYSVALMVGAILVIIPITIRNAIVFRSFIPLTLGAGVNLVEGIADYDMEKRFGLERYDHELTRREAELYDRPDYANNLYRPDGISRERARNARALTVIRSNKTWFLGVIVRRAASMLEYERVSVVSVEPTVTHPLEITNATELIWTHHPTELITNLTSDSEQTRLSLSEDNQALRIISDDSEQGKHVVSAPIDIKVKSDHLLRLPIGIEQGRMAIKIRSVGKGTTLASATIPDSLEPTAPTKGSMTYVQLPFVTRYKSSSDSAD